MAAIYQFQNNLRLKDNPSWDAVCRKNEPIVPIYIYPENYNKSHHCGFSLWSQFRKDSLNYALFQLNESLKACGGKLYVFHSVAEAINVIGKSIQAKSIVTSNLPGVFEKQRINQWLKAGFNVETAYDNSLFEPNQIPFEKIPDVFTHFRKKVEQNASITLEENSNVVPDFFKLDLQQKINMPSIEIHEKSAFPYLIDEEQAFKRIDDYFQKGLLDQYKKTRNGMIGVNYSSKLSPFLAHGVISPKRVWKEIENFEKEEVKNQSTYWLKFELLWREFFFWKAFDIGIDLFKIKGQPGNDKVFKDDRSLFNRWRKGETDSDYVNANMLELNVTGFMSNRGRQNVASYLSKTLGVNWTWGAAYFESQLIDYDMASNWGNWQYVAGVGNDPRDRVFNVDLQAERYDPEGIYTKKWLCY